MLVTVPNPDDLLDLQLFSLESLRAEHGKKAVPHLRRLAIRKIFKGLRPEEVGFRSVQGPMVKPGAKVELPANGIIVGLDYLRANYDPRAAPEMKVPSFQVELTAWTIVRGLLLPAYKSASIEQMRGWLQASS
ncbi:MAG: hypothetical protein ABJM11_19855 [Marinobacter sp.]|uniref:hypothetical protein n=1 Tax=Gammaproteobacteria TaxID=1236 RepID=UPI0032991FB9